MAERRVRYEILTDVEYNIRTNDFPTEHTHNYWEIVLVTDGRIFNRINGETGVVGKDTAVLIKPDDVHSIRVAEDDTMYLNLEIRDGLLKRFLDTIDADLYSEILSEKNLSGQFETGFTENIKNLATNIMLYSTAEEEQKILKRIIFRLIFGMLPDCNKSVHGYGRKKDATERALEVMSREENVRLTLREICEIIGYSESYLIRLFRRKLNTTPNREFTKIKMHYAAKLLRRTDFSVDKIAQLTGYSSKGHFYKLFFEEYGVLPYRYKKMDIREESR